MFGSLHELFAACCAIKLFRVTDVRVGEVHEHLVGLLVCPLAEDDLCCLILIVGQRIDGISLLHFIECLVKAPWLVGVVSKIKFLVVDDFAILKMRFVLVGYLLDGRFHALGCTVKVLGI